MELNAEQVKNEIQSLIKALKNCGGWVKRGNGEGWFNHEILADALALIKELTEENERLRKHEIAYDTPFSKQTMPNILSLEGDAAELYKQIEDKIKTDTVREMQERFEELYTDKLITDDMTVSIGVIKQNIKDIAKEMLEGEVIK